MAEKGINNNGDGEDELSRLLSEHDALSSKIEALASREIQKRRKEYDRAVRLVGEIALEELKIDAALRQRFLERAQQYLTRSRDLEFITKLLCVI